MSTFILCGYQVKTRQKKILRERIKLVTLEINLLDFGKYQYLIRICIRKFSVIKYFLICNSGAVERNVN